MLCIQTVDDSIFGNVLSVQTVVWHCIWKQTYMIRSCFFHLISDHGPDVLTQTVFSFARAEQSVNPADIPPNPETKSATALVWGEDLSNYLKLTEW